ncbi:class A beta-lactamase [Dyella sp. 20L07]|uniref:class A beta-lactamase n=1 Tax=Dyella sp. 20L07 TaxID=3384240 RepID=UPI003D2E1AF1
MKHSVFYRRLLVAAMALSITGTALPSFAADQAATAADATKLQHALDVFAQRARPGLLGVSVLDLQTGATARVNADKAFPMMSVFKAPVAAAVLSRVDDGSLSLDLPVIITRDEVQSGSAIPSIGAHFQGERMTFTVERLLQAAVSESDNTAVDALIKVIGGPQVVTAFLQAHGIKGMRVDEDEAGVGRVFRNLSPGQVMPANETEEAASQRYQRGYRAFLADPRNRSTPDAAVTFLRKLQGNELLTAASTRHLLGLMAAQTIPNRLRAGLPKGLSLADKAGTSGTLDGRTAAYNDIGIVTWPDGHSVIVAAFLMDATASDAERGALFADLARAVSAATTP